MAAVHRLREMLKVRQTPADKERLDLFEGIVADYEERIARCEEEIHHLKEEKKGSKVCLHTADMQQLLVSEEGVLPEPQEPQDSKPPNVKEELWSEEEEKPDLQPQTRRHRSREVEPLCRNSTEDGTLKVEVYGDDCGGPEPDGDDCGGPEPDGDDCGGPEPDGDDCGGPEPDGDVGPCGHFQPQTEDCVDQDDFKEEQERVWIRQQGQQLHPLGGESHITGVSVKTENDDEKTGQADGEDNGGPQPASNPGTNSPLQPHAAGRRSNSFGCSECGQRFGQKGGLKIHMRIHTGEKPYVCSECGQKFVHKDSLKAHIRIHTGEKPYACSECGQKFVQQGSLKRHTRIHTGEKPFVCTECGQRFVQKGNLKTHMKIHTGEKPFGCSECGQRFIQKDSLKIHMRIHTGEKPFLCFECGQRFVQKCNLKTHMRIHTGEKPFVCSVCNQMFAQKETLNIHMRIHTGEKPFVCSECGKRFAHKSHLNIHIRLHAIEKPFSCSDCCKRYKYKASLDKHRRIHKEQKNPVPQWKTTLEQKISHLRAELSQISTFMGVKGQAP